MFGFEKRETTTASTLSEMDIQQIEDSIKGTVLENDEATLRMIETGFVSPNGVQQDPSEFIKLRLAIVESGSTGGSIDEDAMVQHSPAPEAEHGSLSQL
jgi:hypothetical protein